MNTDDNKPLRPKAELENLLKKLEKEIKESTDDKTTLFLRKLYATASDEYNLYYND